MKLNSCDKTDELRRLALQIAIQLPESVTDARRVLKMAGECLDNFLIEGGAERSPRQRARRLGWRIDAVADEAAADPAAEAAPPPLPLVAIACALSTLLVTVPLAALLLDQFGYGPGLCFGLAVVAVAIVFGTAPALLLAGVSPIVHNLFVVAPYSQFGAPTTYEAVMACGYVVFAVAVPLLMRYRAPLCRLAADVSRRLI